MARHPDVCEELHWGKRLACVVVDLERAPPRLVKELIEEAWATKAPASLVAALGRGPGGRATSQPGAIPPTANPQVGYVGSPCPRARP